MSVIESTSRSSSDRIFDCETYHEATNVELYRLPDQLVLVKLIPRFADTYLQN